MLIAVFHSEGVGKRTDAEIGDLKGYKREKKTTTDILRT